jgi:hypothetical protein
MKAENYSKKVFDTLKELHRQFPTWNLCRHLDTVLEEYNGKFWGVEDKDLYYALLKYQEELQIEYPEDIDRVIQEGYTLDAMLRMPEPFDEEEYEP